MRTSGEPYAGPPVSVRLYFLPPPLPPPDGLLPRPPPLGLPVVDGALGGLPDPLDIGMLLSVCSQRRTRLAHPVRELTRTGVILVERGAA